MTTKKKKKKDSSALRQGSGQASIETPKDLGIGAALDRAGDVPKPEEALAETVSVVDREKVPEVPPSLAQEKLWTIGTWRGRTQWKCTQCAWDTLEGEAKMREHIKAAHRPPPSPILIADKSGRQIN